MSTINTITPAMFGLPSKFSSFRSGQLEAITGQILDTGPGSPRFEIVCAPTGFGKTLTYMAAALMGGKRMAVLTSTKGLQDQLRADFGEMKGFVDLRGQSNYECIAGPQFGLLNVGGKKPTVNVGPCKSGARCELKLGGCEYYDRYAKARVCDVVSTNYALWMYDTMKSDDVSKYETNLMMKREVEILVLDEAHNAPQHLADFLAEEISESQIQRAGCKWPDGLGDKPEELEEWRGWALAEAWGLFEKIQSRMKAAREGKMQIEELRRVGVWKRMMGRLNKIAGMKGEWVAEMREQYRGRGGEKEEEDLLSPESTGNYTGLGRGLRKEKVVRFDPLWPSQYAENVLFRKVKKIVLVSATVRPKTADVLGIVPSEVRFREYGSSFPIRSRPVIHVPTVQMNHRTEKEDWKIMMWLGMMDRIMGGREGRRGVIHSVSYSRAELIVMNSINSLRMLSHNSTNRASVVEQFKRSSGPSAILVSPSVDTGYDFPYQECEWQIIAKLPFPDNRAKIIKRRMERDKEYGNYLVAQVLVQMTGRGMRAEDDRCETLIVDDNVQWFVSGNKKFFPKWWLESYVEWKNDGTIPGALPKLEKVAKVGRDVDTEKSGML